MHIVNQAEPVGASMPCISLWLFGPVTRRTWLHVGFFDDWYDKAALPVCGTTTDLIMVFVLTTRVGKLSMSPQLVFSPNDVLLRWQPLQRT